MHIKRICRKRTAGRNIPYHRFQHHRHRLRRSVCRSFRIRLLCCKRIIRYFRTLYCRRSLLYQSNIRLCFSFARAADTHHASHRHKQLKKCICFHTLYNKILFPCSPNKNKRVFNALFNLKFCRHQPFLLPSNKRNLLKYLINTRTIFIKDRVKTRIKMVILTRGNPNSNI